MADLQKLLEMLNGKVPSQQEELQQSIGNVVAPYSKAPEKPVKNMFLQDLGIGNATMAPKAQQYIQDKSDELFGEEPPVLTPDGGDVVAPAPGMLRKPAALQKKPTDEVEAQPLLDSPVPQSAPTKSDEYTKLLEELAKAQKGQAWNDIGSNMTQIGNEFIANAVPGYKLTNPDEVKEERALGSRGIEAIKQRLDSTKSLTDERKARSEADLESEKMDPNSPVSQQARDLAKQLLGSDVPATMTASQLNTLLPGIQQKASLDFKRDDMAQRAEDRKLQRDMMANRQKEFQGLESDQEKRRVNENYNKFLDKRTSENPMFKKFMEKQDTFGRIDELIGSAEKGNEAAVAALGTQMARAMGEVGVLTDADVTRYLGNSSYGRKLQSWYEKGMEGKIPKAQGNEMRDVASLFKNMNEVGLNKIYDDAAVRFAQSYPDSAKTEEERLAMAYKRLGHPKFTNEARESVKKLKGEKGVGSGTPLPTRSMEPGAAPKSNEVRRKTKDGKVAIFDGDTKQFLRYE